VEEGDRGLLGKEGGDGANSQMDKNCMAVFETVKLL
jgi:hypothetical protein